MKETEVPAEPEEQRWLGPGVGGESGGGNSAATSKSKWWWLGAGT